MQLRLSALLLLYRQGVLVLFELLCPLSQKALFPLNSIELRSVLFDNGSHRLQISEFGLNVLPDLAVLPTQLQNFTVLCRYLSGQILHSLPVLAYLTRRLTLVSVGLLYQLFVAVLKLSRASFDFQPLLA